MINGDLTTSKTKALKEKDVDDVLTLGRPQFWSGNSALIWGEKKKRTTVAYSC